MGETTIKSVVLTCANFFESEGTLHSYHIEVPAISRSSRAGTINLPTTLGRPRHTHYRYGTALMPRCTCETGFH